MTYKSQNNNLNKNDSFYCSILNTENDTLTNNINKTISNIDPILKEEEYHYLCPKCNKFPFIEFSKSKKYVKLTCSCYNKKNILIKDLFDKSKNYMTIKEFSFLKNLYSNNNGEGLECKTHLKPDGKFKYFCKTCLINI